jgi:protein SCO1/2
MGVFKISGTVKRMRWSGWHALGVIFIIAVGVGYFISIPEKMLPVIQPSDLNPALVDPNQWHQSQHRTLPFSLINHLGDSVSEADVDGKVRVVDFFFTRCATICPIMTSHMAEVQEALQGNEGWLLMSHSVTPEADSVSVLKAYAERYQADSNHWWFLTGSKKEIYRLARTSYFACYDEANGGDGGWQDFIHTENVVLIDQLGRLRGFYDGTDSESVNQLIEDAQWLLQKKRKKKAE